MNVKAIAVLSASLLISLPSLADKTMIRGEAAAAVHAVLVMSGVPKVSTPSERYAVKDVVCTSQNLSSNLVFSCEFTERDSNVRHALTTGAPILYEALSESRVPRDDDGTLHVPSLECYSIIKVLSSNGIETGLQTVHTCEF